MLKKQRDGKLKAALKEAVIIFTAVSVFALLFNHFRVSGIALVGDWSNEISGAGFLRISLKEAQKEFQQGRAVFLDVRSQARYQQGHIPRSLSLPYESFYESFPAIKAKILPNMKIITYDEGKEFFFGEDLAGLLRGLGFKDIRVFLDGWSQWEEANFPVEKSDLL